MLKEMRVCECRLIWFICALKRKKKIGQQQHNFEQGHAVVVAVKELQNNHIHIASVVGLL